jgi:hypothetical protein
MYKGLPACLITDGSGVSSFATKPSLKPAAALSQQEEVVVEEVKPIE